MALVVALAVCLGVSAIGGLFTSTSVGTWYQTLERPSWTPPGWLFGPVWITLYAAMAVAAWDVWRSPGPTGRALALFAAQLVANAAWSGLFFGLRDPALALVDIVLLDALIVATTIAFWSHRRRAGAMLIPYLLWTSFATCLNASIWWLNRGA